VRGSRWPKKGVLRAKGKTEPLLLLGQELKVRVLKRDVK
jgi:hypothetical protein